MRSAAAKPAAAQTGFRPWHFFILISMAGATVAVMLSVHTHPVALLLLSAAVVCAGIVGLALHRAIDGFLQRGAEQLPLPAGTYEDLLREKSLALRSIKELEFDKAMGKVSDADFAEISSRLRARALSLMAELDRTPVASAAKRASAPAPAAAATTRSCASCGTVNDTDARFCKNCGSGLGESK
ncbi:MAG TPA: zinc ribbon domain-containing protein [Vicinamibacterales bacterium]|nr:zinc ribbon domain-containing protein [Vicinamibacterales bacterium]